MRRVAGLALLVFLLAGCGQKEADQQGMNARFERLDYQIGSRETIAAPYDKSIAALTRKYAALVREYADQLGPKEARKRLTEKGDELGNYCLACAAILYDAAKKY
jgi:hypothetical protein